MRVLITGGAGFIASHVTNLLGTQHPGYTLVVLDKMGYAAHRDNITVPVTLVKGDICNEDTVRNVFETHAITHVLHFAAETHVDNSFLDSLPFSVSNVVGTDVLLRQSKRAPGFRRFLHVSTDEVYGECVDGSFDENAAMMPSNPYSASKAGAELLVQAYIRSFGFPALITRANNVYGPHQYPEKLVPKLLLQGLAGRPLTVHGGGQSVRNYLYAEDAARAFVHLLHAGQTGEIYNISGAEEHSTLSVAQALQRAFRESGRPVPPLQHVRDRAFNDCRYSVSSDKLRALGWAPAVKLEDGLRRCFRWYAERSGEGRYAGVPLAAHPSAHPDTQKDAPASGAPEEDRGACA